MIITLPMSHLSTLPPPLFSLESKKSFEDDLLNVIPAGEAEICVHVVENGKE